MKFENTGIHIKNKPSHRRLIASSVIIPLLLIAAMVFNVFTQKQKSDPASEKVIREAVARQLNKDPNKLTDEDFEKITKLSLQGKELCDIKLLEKFPNLRELDLGNIEFPQKLIPRWMKFLAKFGFIDLKRRFTLDLSPLKSLTELQDLSLAHSIGVKDISPLSSLANLKTLYLKDNQISDVEPIRGLVNLEFLGLAGNPVTSLEPIRELENLKELWLYNLQVSDFEPIKELANLKTLRLFEMPNSIIEPVKKLKNLRTLELEGCNDITDEQIENLRKALPELNIGVNLLQLSPMR